MIAVIVTDNQINYWNDQCDGTDFPKNLTSCSEIYIRQLAMVLWDSQG
jgi:hypothetical protein